MQNAMVLPDGTCNAIDFERDPIWSLTTYMKGACFYEEVADLIDIAAGEERGFADQAGLELFGHTRSSGCSRDRSTH